MVTEWSRLTRPASHLTVAATLSTVLLHLPIFLLSSLTVLMRDEISGLNEATLGVAASVFFAATAMASIGGGWLSETRGPRLGMIAAALMSGLSLLVLGTATEMKGVLAACFLGGVGNGLGQPASNLGLYRGVRNPRQGTAFGIKQSSVPLASLLAGLSIPFVGLTVGWRWTFALSLVLVLVVVVIVPRRFPADPSAGTLSLPTDASRFSLMLIAAGAGLGSAAANSLAAFTVVTAVEYGVGAAPAGYLLGMGSTAAVVSRLIAGWRADQRGRAHLTAVVKMVAAGSVGYIFLAAGGLHAAALGIGVVIGFAFGWGWPGLLAFTVVQMHPSAPGHASGVVLAGGTAGAVAGPLIFGLAVRGDSFASAWLIAAVVSVLAAVLLAVARWRMLATAE